MVYRSHFASGASLQSVHSPIPARMEPHQLVANFARPHTVLHGRDIDKVVRLAECLKEFLMAQCRRFVSERRHQPILEVFMSDGAPLTTTCRFKRSLGSETIRRTGKKCKEYLIQRLFLMDISGECKVYFQDPIPMKDKSAWTHHRAQYDMWPLARTMKHTSIIISHHVWVMAIKRPCERHSRQRHSALAIHLEDEENSDEVPSEMLRLMSWFTCVACFAHHGHNALRWALVGYIDDPETTRSAWIVLASLRNSFDLLVTYLPMWLTGRLKFKNYRDDTLPALWSLLGESEKWVQLLSELQIRFEDGCLCLAAGLEHDPSAADKATAALLHLWRFRAWSDSRWCGIGPSRKALMGCLLCGLHDLVDFIMQSKTASKYYIQGFSRLTQQVRDMIVLVSCSSHLAENFVAQLLDDDRLPRVLPSIDTRVRFDIITSMTIPESILSVLAAHCSFRPFTLRTEIMNMLCVQAGYLEARLREARGLPWCLLSGDIAHNVEELKHADAPTDETAQKIQQLAKLGVPTTVLSEGIMLLGQCPWSTKAVEQPHAVSKCLMQAHNQHGADAMLARPMVTQAKPLVTFDVEERKVGRVQHRLERLQRRQPRRSRADTCPAGPST